MKAVAVELEAVEPSNHHLVIYLDVFSVKNKSTVESSLFLVDRFNVHTLL